MKKVLLAFIIISFFSSYLSLFLSPKTFANENIPPAKLYAVAVPTDTPTPPPGGITDIPPGTWLSDAEVTFAGKNAARSKEFFNWTLQFYKWAYSANPLIDFWAKIRNIVFLFLIFLVLITAFSMIVTGGKSITAISFIRKFVLILFLITFSFAFIQILYQIVDFIQGFFIRNPQGQIISSKDLLNIGWDYVTFTGFRKFGADYNESAFISLLLIRLTAATYFIMAAILMIRKVILWFFITVSPIYPILMLYFPIRNTAKIWLGEFFRWLLYAPLFTIFLSGLVVLWQQKILILPFDFANQAQKVEYPTAVNILLGGPGQTLAIDNNVNYVDTFAQYVLALIMLWVVIFLPFVLLRIFLDYLSNVSLSNNSALKYITNNAQKLFPNNDFFVGQKTPSTPPPPKSPPPSYHPTGVARELPFAAGSAKAIPRGASDAARPIGATTSTTRQVAQFKSQKQSSETKQLLSFPIPTMRDIAKYETTRISTDKNHEVSQVHDTLQKIANPWSISSTTERQQFSSIREKLIQQKINGNQVAGSVLNAANNITTISQRSQSSVTNQQSIVQKLANPQSVTSTREREQITTIKESLTQQSKQGNPIATSMLNTINNVTNNTQQNVSSVSNLTETLQKISNPQSVTSTTDRQQFTNIHNSLAQAASQGNPVATMIMSTATSLTQNTTQSATSEKVLRDTLEKIASPETITSTTEKQQFIQIRDQLKQQQAKGEPLAVSVLAAADEVHQAKAGQKTTTRSSQIATLPAVNQVQTVNLEDYEEVKKTWLENYRKIEVPKTIDQPNRTREEWVKQDVAKVSRAIDLLTSQDQQKVTEGMQEVGNILPFLMIGGFSQTEVVAYLQAKKHAGEEALSGLSEQANEEDTLIDTRRKTTHATTHVQHISETAASGSDDDEPSPIADIRNYAVVNKINNYIQNSFKSQQSTATMQLMNFPIPTMRDVARYESIKEQQTNTQVRETLQKIANPETITNQTEKDQYIKLKEQLIEAKAKGDPLAISIATVVDALSTHPEVKEDINQLATATSLPHNNQVQTVNLEDYEDVRQTWHENYNTSEVPSSLDKPNRTREEWVSEDIANLKQTIGLLQSQDPQKVKEGMKNVASILPFLLIGGFSQAEVIAYLQAKLHAAEEVSKELHGKKEEEETIVDVDNKSKIEAKSFEADVEENK